jgi:hypothetical protein
MLALVGAFNVAEGLIAIYGGKVVRLDPDRVLLLDLAGWAQVTLALGALLLALGIWLSMVTVRVRLIALSVVVVHALIQLGVLAAFPAWALLMISFDVVIIFALTATPAGAAASVARGGATAGVRAGDALKAGSGTAADARSGVTREAAASGRPASRGRYAAVDRVGYRPRHQVTGTPATVVMGQPLPGSIRPGTCGAPTAPRALPAAPSAGPTTGAVKPGTNAPATATMVGAVARTTTGPAEPAPPGTARGVAAPIIGAISGRWPDESQRP